MKIDYETIKSIKYRVKTLKMKKVEYKFKKYKKVAGIVVN